MKLSKSRVLLMALSFQQLHKLLSLNGDLSIHQWKFSVDDAKILGTFIRDNKVKTFYLFDSHIRAKGVKDLAEELKDSQVQKLNISGCNIGTEGAKALAEVLKESQVQTLELSSNNIGAEGAKAIINGIKDTYVTNFQSLYDFDTDNRRKLSNVLEENQRRLLRKAQMIAFGIGMAAKHSQVPVEVIDLISKWLPNCNFGRASPQVANNLLGGEDAEFSLMSAIALKARETTFEIFEIRKTRTAIEMCGSILRGETEHLNDDTRVLRRVISDNPQVFFRPQAKIEPKAKPEVSPLLITWR